MPDDPKRNFAGGPEPKFFTIDKFMGINTQAKRQGVKDQQFSWLENMQPIGNGNLRTLLSNGGLATPGKTIIYMYFYNIYK
jgi:hypothetical protein